MGTKLIQRDAIMKMCVFAMALVLTAPVTAQDSTDEEEGMHLEEVQVTAQRRTENLQDVPISVTAVNEEFLALAQVNNITNISLVTSTIKFDVTNSAANSANLLIRGVGTVGNTRAFEGAVGVFIDGVYRTRAGQAMQNWLDVASLEVLRGPQGTLFGKNTSAGALLINSTAPNPERLSFDYDVEFGNYSQILGRAALNAPLSEHWTMRIAGLWGERDGYIKDPNGGDYNERKPRAVKAQLLFQPSESFSAQLIADWSDESNNCCYGNVDVIDGPVQPLINALILGRGLELPSADFDDYEQVLSRPTDQDITDKGVVLKMQWDLAEGRTLNSITAYRDWKISQWWMDADFTGANILFINESLSTKTFSQEFTLNGDVGAFGPFEHADYVAGFYYANEDIDAHHELLWGNQAQAYFDVYFGASGFPPGTADATEGKWSDVDMPADATTWALFTHWNFDVSDRLGFTAGLRYSKDDKNGQMIRNYYYPAPNDVFRLLAIQPGPEYKDNFSDSALTGTLSVKYHFSDFIMGYASYSGGYKSGGVNIDNTAAGTRFNNPTEIPGAVPEDPTYKSEFIDAYELGIKTEYLNGHARSNIAGFYYDISDLQIAQFTGTRFTIDNAPDATVYGFEMDNQFILSDTWSLWFDLTHIAKAEFGNDAILGPLAGRDFAHAPKWAGNIALNMDQPLTGNLSLFGRAGYYYSSKLYTNTSNDYTRGGQGEVNLTLGLRSDTSRWAVSLWCQNCTDERYVTQHFNSPLQGADANAYVAAPRTYGIRLRGTF